VTEISGSSGEGNADCYAHTTPEACAAAGICVFWDASEVGLVDGQCVNTADYREVGWCAAPSGPPGGSIDMGGYLYETATGRVFAFPSKPFPSIPGWAECICEEGEPPACSCATCFKPPGTTGPTGTSGTTAGDTNGVTTSSG
jgi:hypothetical protein